jgi:diguanylate cyclase (GGDEF)-like protein
MRLRFAALSLFAALCLFACAAGAWAAPTSPLRFQRLAAVGPDELSVLALLQDRQGFVWIGTHAEGLYRHDGYRAVKYTNSPANPHTLPHDRVSALFEDVQGRIWVGTQNGLARFNPLTNDFTRFMPPGATVANSQLIIKQIISDGRSGMWIATWGGLQHFNPDSGTFDAYVHDPAQADSLGANDLNAIALDDKGGLWLGTWPGGLDYLAPGTRRFRHYRLDSADQPDPKLNIVRGLHFAPDKTLWIGTEKGVLTWDTRQPWAERRRLDTPSTRVHWFFADRDGAVWAGTLSAGLLRFPKGQTVAERFVHRATDPHSLPSDHVRAVMQDRSGMLWVGTFTDGIALVNLNSTGFRRLIPFDEDARRDGPNNAIQSIAGSGDGKLWLGTNSGFTLFDPVDGQVLQTWRAEPGKEGALSNNIVYSMYQQPHGPLWVGTSAGLNRLDAPDAPIKVIRFGNVAADFINAIAPGSGGWLWLGTGANVIHFHPASNVSESFGADPKDPDSRSVTGTTTIVEDRRGRVWMGSEWNGGGLDMLEPSSRKFRHFRHVPGDPNSISDDNVSTLYQDPAGRLWAGTAKGVNEVLAGADGQVRFRSYALLNGIGATKILAMRADQAGKLWMSSSAGILRLDPDSGKIDQFTAADGTTEGFTVAAGHLAADGTIYFAGVKGMTAVEPTRVHRTSSPPLVAITDLAVFNRSLRDGHQPDDVRLLGPVTAPRKLTLSAEDSVFSIEFAALHFTDPLKNTYAYRLAGFDRDWIDTDASHRVATYTNLDPGEYTFEIKAANDQHVWSADATRLLIVILPPYWQTWWFRVLAAAATMGLLGAIYRVRVRRLTRQQQELQRVVADRTRELEESNAKLAALSTTDALTGIGNRRSFDAALASEWRRAKRSGQPVALAMLDVDLFKAYNDHYGHQAGDQCLRTVAELIAGHGRRPADVVARYGGEEFVLLAPATDAGHAMRIAQEICAELQALGLPHEYSPYGVVTISIGVAVLDPQAGGTAELLVQLADQALYRAKQAGRNRAELAET